MADDRRPMQRTITNTGIRFAIVFIIGFALLGYPPLLTLLLGAIAGGAGGVFGAWWQAKDTDGELGDSDRLTPLARARQQLAKWRRERRQKNKGRLHRYQRPSSGATKRSTARSRKSKGN
jgi:hypothetical protein